MRGHKKDPNTTHIFSDFLVLLIHSFRMPIFFVVAGIFGAMLFYERQPIRMIRNRISRIVLPFIVFLFLLWPIIIFAFGYTNAVFSQLENPFEKALESLKRVSQIFYPKRHPICGFVLFNLNYWNNRNFGTFIEKHTETDHWTNVHV